MLYQIERKITQKTYVEANNETDAIEQVKLADITGDIEWTDAIDEDAVLTANLSS
jgi:hypothetical protein